MAVFVGNLACLDLGLAHAALSQTEVLRAATIGSTRRRNQFVCGRAILRTALHAWGGGGAAWSIVDAPPAPFVKGPSAPFVSIAHSRDRVVCAVAQAPVGVDIEFLRLRDHHALAQEICAPEELQAYLALAETERAERFYSLWVLKEALYKCFRPMSLADVPILRFAHEVTCAGAAVSLFATDNDYVGGVALRGATGVRLHVHDVCRNLTLVAR